MLEQLETIDEDLTEEGVKAASEQRSLVLTLISSKPTTSVSNHRGLDH
jgi:hypothetical protein